VGKMKSIKKKVPFEKYSGKGEISLYEIEGMIEAGRNQLSFRVIMRLYFFDDNDNDNDNYVTVRKIMLYFEDGISGEAQLTFIDKHPEITDKYKGLKNYRGAILNGFDFEFSDFTQFIGRSKWIKPDSVDVYETSVGKVLNIGEIKVLEK
jgi:hypothetical protein